MRKVTSTSSTAAPANFACHSSVPKQNAVGAGESKENQLSKVNLLHLIGFDPTVLPVKRAFAGIWRCAHLLLQSVEEIPSLVTQKHGLRCQAVSGIQENWGFFDQGGFNSPLLLRIKVNSNIGALLRIRPFFWRHQQRPRRLISHHIHRNISKNVGIATVSHSPTPNWNNKAHKKRSSLLIGPIIVMGRFLMRYWREEHTPALIGSVL